MRLLIAAFAALFVATPAHAEWYRAETNNFVIISEDGEEEVRRFAAELERFDMALRYLQNMPIGEEQPTDATKLTVYRFGDVGDIGRMAGASGVAGFYIPRAGDSVAFSPAREERRRSMTVVDVDRSRNRVARLDAVSVLQHEYVHYFMMQHFPAAYPAWYVEGYAELLATIRFNDDGTFHVGDPPQYRAAQIFQLRQFPLEDMLDQEHELAGYEGYQFYGTGWLLAHYLNFDPTRLAQLNEYLVAIGEGEDSLTAARRIFGDLDQIDRELRQYRDGAFPGYDVTTPGYVEPQPQIRRLTAIEEDLIREEMELRRGVDKDEARGIAGDIRRKAGDPLPSDPHALALLARALYYAEDYDDALATAERLKEVDGNAIMGPLVASWVASERAEDDPAWQERAVRHAADALAIDEHDPRSRIAYYYSYLAAGMEVPENAIIALEQAFDTAGSDPSYRVFLSRQLIFEDRLSDAKAVLQPIAFRGHNQGQRDEDDTEDGPPGLDDIMAEINEGDRDAALTMIDELIDWEPED
ncbi:hypothetical protein [Aurantiacibacter hainanensis]|uniref:hypothetical protein n=1 Tax=Aurantiacibacter hainanensis TaxID=3076114 RepID=UPI0030C6737B